MARRVKSLHFNLGDGESIPFHREHRSKKGRNRWNKADSPAYLKKKRKLELLKAGVDRYSLRLFKRRYKI